MEPPLGQPRDDARLDRRALALCPRRALHVVLARVGLRDEPHGHEHVQLGQVDRVYIFDKLRRTGRMFGSSGRVRGGE
jgi:hypothetical protein